MRLQFFRRYPDIVALLAILALLNLHLLGLPVDHRSFVVAPSAIEAGRWWTPLTHGFVHVSLYHLVLDAGAVLLIYPVLASRATERLLALTVCIAGSAMAAMLMPEIDSFGFCGLSGAGHGLMAILALQLAKEEERTKHRAGLALALALLLKSLLEAVTGEVAFGFMHVGAVGVPNTLSHLGGTLTGLIYGSYIYKAHRSGAARQQNSTWMGMSSDGRLNVTQASSL